MTRQAPAWVEPLFRSVDERDADAFVSFLADGVSFRFGNAPAVEGKAAVGEVVRGFFDSIAALSHRLVDTWQHEDRVICHGTVTYTRHDASTLTVPFANIFRTRDDLIDEYLIYVDASALYVPADA